MHYDHPERMIRPPGEAHSILLQITSGCSHNKCTFCGAYKGLRFRIKPEEIVMADIEWAARHMADRRRLFLCDGDALIVPQKRLVRILTAIRDRLPRVNRVTLYANARSIHLKTPEELAELRALGVQLAYFGLESGDDVILKQVKKGADAARMIETGRKIRAAGVRLFLTVLTGLGGRERSEIHARETGRVLSAIDPECVGALSLMPAPGAPLFEKRGAAAFDLLTPEETLRELREMIARTELSRGLFYANHASNYLPLKARLPAEKEETLQRIDQALQGRIGLRPEALRRF
ncbi:MAG: radical SAM protein [Desulfobacterales bacterium]|nr:MAG: radical SAM protein [Desulfobacterales bacterium]